MRCFIAIDIDQQIKEKLWNLCKTMPNQSLKKVKKENYHITLKFLGDIKNIKPVKEKVDKINYQPFRATFAKLGVFPNPDFIRTIWTGARGNFNPLAQQIHHIFGKDRFHPHVTIARVKKKPPNQLHQWIDKNKTTYIGKQRIEKISLKKSTLTKKGPIYQDIKVVPLE